MGVQHRLRMHTAGNPSRGRRFCVVLSAGTVLRYDLPSSFNADIDPAGVDADLAELEQVRTEGTCLLAR